MKPVLTKVDFVRRYKSGEFGNRSPTWSTVQDFFEDIRGHGVKGWNGPRLFHLRNRIAGGATYYNLTTNQLVQQLSKVEGMIDDYYVSEMAPHDRNLIQGEIEYGCGGFRLYYSELKDLPMRNALLEGGKHEGGLSALVIMRYYMDDKSYDWLQYLLEEYPDHVVEFSTFSKCWGTIPGMNTVFWEVRRY